MYDLIVIGAGWAGFSAAVDAAKNNFKTALIERDALGGTCLNYGCIPTKTLLTATKLLSQFKKSAKFGLSSGPAAVDLAGLNQRVRDVNAQLRAGLDFRVKSHKIDFLKGSARIINANQIGLGERILDTKYILIATGSRPIELPKIKFDGAKIISSSEALNIQDIPKKLLIIGGGVIGCEFAEVFSSLGSSVEIVELTGGLLPGLDPEAARKIEVLFKKRGLKVSLNTDASSLDLAVYDKVLLCVGRAPYSDCFDGLNINKERNRIAVNAYLQTNIPNIYAAGDCIGGYLLAHVASYEGRVAVKNMLTANQEKVRYKAVPSCIFTNPEIAACGLSQEEARQAYGEIIIKKFDFRALGMGYVLDETDGFLKIIADKDENIIGASIVGPKATELIHILALAINNNLKLAQVRGTIFAHPTVSEAISECLLQ